ncbi:hypothetical protein TWF694_005605 [Orbilia ellipsospora]|uniref:Uncharacterized protein n=1 Tax=Orbilia ellipsospora TaxID=2528407 RepID=A0AAV9WTR0_9PEZI
MASQVTRLLTVLSCIFFILFLEIPIATSKITIATINTNDTRSYTDPFDMFLKHTVKYKRAASSLHFTDPNKIRPPPQFGTKRIGPIITPEAEKAHFRDTYIRSVNSSDPKCQAKNIYCGASSNVTLETQMIYKPGIDPFGGNSALLFAYAQSLAGIMLPSTTIGSIGMTLHLTPPFYPGITVEDSSFWSRFTRQQSDAESVMNYQVWRYADCLLRADLPVWGCDRGSYFQFYSDYLRYASTNRTSGYNDNLKARNEMLRLTSQLRAGSAALDSTKDDAIRVYKQFVCDSASSGTKLADELHNLTTWFANDNEYQISRKYLTEVAKLYNIARLEYYGEGFQEVNALLSSVILAKEYFNSEPGFNMPCASYSKSLAQRLWEAEGGVGDRRDRDTDTFYKPMYTIDNYPITVNYWRSNYHAGTQPKTLLALSIDDLADVASPDWSSLGFRDLHSQHEVDVPPKDTILSLITKDGTLTPRVEDIIITSSDFGVFTISRGKWEKTNFRSSYPKLRADAPLNLSSKIVRPRALLFGYGLKIRLRINDEDFEELSRSLDGSDGVKVRLLGAEDVKLKIEAGRVVSTSGMNGGFPYLLAVLGEIL